MTDSTIARTVSCGAVAVVAPEVIEVVIATAPKNVAYFTPCMRRLISGVSASITTPPIVPHQNRYKY